MIMQNGTSIHILLLVSCLLQCGRAAPKRKLPKNWQKQVDALQDDVTKIINHVTKGPGKHVAYNKLAELTDRFGSRLSGSDSLETAIDYLVDEIGSENLDVTTEAVKVPHWVRGEESAWLIEPRPLKMDILGLGTSVGTPPGGIQAEAIVVNSFDELTERASEAEGKIVVFNQDWEGYFDTYKYRGEGATRAAEVGAVAVLTRSLTELSVYSPHTGVQRYGDGVTQIPAACLTVEDAEYLDRVHLRGEPILINLTMEAENLARSNSRNVVTEIKGSSQPDEVVIFGGHIDSWDVGVGAMDDGGGVVISWQVLTMLKELGLTPKRTMRAVFWTAEEVGADGAKAYFQAHKNESVSLVMESDQGTFSPYGIGFKGSGLAKAVLEELLLQLEPINATTVSDDVTGTVDVRDWTDAGFSTVALNVDPSDYFKFHHTRGDSMSVIDPDELDRCAIVWAVVAYAAATFDDMLPSDGKYPTSNGAQLTTTWDRQLLSILPLFWLVLLVVRPRS